MRRRCLALILTSLRALAVASLAVRGGSWGINSEVVRVSYRGRGGPGGRNFIFGARCVGE